MLEGVLTGAGLCFLIFAFKSITWLMSYMKWKTVGKPAIGTVGKLISEKTIYKNKRETKISHKEYVYGLDVTYNGKTYHFEHNFSNIPTNSQKSLTGETLNILLDLSKNAFYDIKQQKKEITGYLKGMGISLVIIIICVAIVFAIYG